MEEKVGTVMKEERIKQIESYINDNELCSLDHLCDVFNISKATLRRDLSTLEKAGTIRKVYGGVASNKKDAKELVPFLQREITHHDEKMHIGKLAADLCRDGETVYIDSGTTTLQMGEYLKDRNITVVTGNLNLINMLQEFSNVNIISVGGQLARGTNSFVGDLAVNTVLSLNISKSFMAATGISIDAGLTNTSPLETAIKKSAIAKSKSVYALIDSSKWGVVSLMTYAEMNQVTGIITNKAPKVKYTDYCNAHNIKLIY